MTKGVEFFFDVGSPASYLACTQIERIAREAGAELRWRPMLLGGVFKATGNASPVTVPAKGRWMLGDLQQWAAHWGVPLQFSRHFPVNTLTVMRIAAGLQLRGSPDFRRYLDAVFSALWVDGKNLGDAAVLADVLRDAGLDADALAALAADPEVKAALIATTEEAVARGVFGAPTIFVGGRMFFGQDRLHFVEQALRGA
jgi:2-hydroxychromene-2-carboxylate isomerase